MGLAARWCKVCTSLGLMLHILHLCNIIISTGTVILLLMQYQLSVFVTSHKLEKSLNVWFLMSQITVSCLEYVLLLLVLPPPPPPPSDCIEVWIRQKLQPVRTGVWGCLVIFGALSGPVCGECCFWRASSPINQPRDPTARAGPEPRPATLQRSVPVPLLSAQCEAQRNLINLTCPTRQPQI